MMDLDPEWAMHLSDGVKSLYWIGLLSVTGLSAWGYSAAGALERALTKFSTDELEEKAKDGDELILQWLPRIRQKRRMNQKIRIWKAISLLLFGASAAFLCQSLAAYLPFRSSPVWNPLVGLLSTILLFCLLATIGGEWPVAAASQNPDKTFRKTLPFYQACSILLAPVMALSRRLSEYWLRKRQISPEEEAVLINEDELKALLDRVNESGRIPDEEQELIENAFAFGDKTVQDCMTHRVDLIAVDRQAKADEILTLLAEEKFSRVPVYEGDIDHIIGQFNSRDFLIMAAQKGTLNFQKTWDLNQILREANYTPENARVSSVFRRMQKEHIHLMVVIDEYGGTAGVVTMEDFLEEIVGQIQDEYDEEEPEIQAINDYTWLVDGGTSLEDLEERTGIRLSDEDEDTLAGWFLSKLDRIPESGEKPTVREGRLQFVVEEMEDRRLKKIRVEMLPDAEGITT